MDPRGFSGWRPGSVEYRRHDNPTGGPVMARKTYLPRFIDSWPSTAVTAVILGAVVVVLFLGAYAWLLAR